MREARLLLLLLFLFMAAATACASDGVPTSSAEFCNVYGGDFARVAPFTPAGTEAENRARVTELVAVLDRLHAASPKPIRDRARQAKDYAHSVREVLDRTGYDLQRYNDSEPPPEVLAMLSTSPTDSLTAINEYAANNCS